MAILHIYYNYIIGYNFKNPKFCSFIYLHFLNKSSNLACVSWSKLGMEEKLFLLYTIRRRCGISGEVGARQVKERDKREAVAQSRVVVTLPDAVGQLYITGGRLGPFPRRDAVACSCVLGPLDARFRKLIYWGFLRLFSRRGDGVLLTRSGYALFHFFHGA